MPYAGWGPCQFLPPIGSPTDNTDCPNAVFDGDIVLETASDIERLSGCQRVSGNLTVASSTLTSLEGLEALQVIDGNLDVVVEDVEGRPRTNPKLKGLTGLDHLTCVAGDAEIRDDLGLWRDAKALGNLVEVGENLTFTLPGPLVGLRRVFGVTATLDDDGLPALEVAIGGFFWNSSAPRAHYVGDASGCFYESVLGCDWTVQTQSALEAIADVMYAVRRLEISGAVSSLAPLDKLVKAGSLIIDAAAIESIEPLRALRRASTLELAHVGITGVDALADLGPVPDVEIGAVPKLRTLVGLENLQAKNFVVFDAPELESLAAVSLAEKCRDVTLENAPKLANIEALSAVRDVERLTLDRLGIEDLRDLSDIRVEFLTVTNNARLNYLGLADSVVYSLLLQSNPVLTAPGGLATARFSALLRIDDNDAMTTLAGLPPLDDAELHVTNNDSLTHLEGVKGLRTSLVVANNASLQSLDGLELEDPTGVNVDGNPALEDLSALAGSTIGSFNVANSPKIEALPAIVLAGGTLSINDNAELASVSGIEGAPDVWAVIIAHNAKLASLAGLELTAVGTLTIQDNATLSDLSALAGVSVNELSVVSLPQLAQMPALVVGPGALTLRDNAGLTSISALESATGVSSATVGENAQLGSLQGMPRAKELSIFDNASLVNLTGLEGQSVLDQLVILDNPALQSLRALAGVTSVGSVGIYDNAVLPDCEIVWFGELIGQQLLLEANGPSGPCP